MSLRYKELLIDRHVSIERDKILIIIRRTPTNRPFLGTIRPEIPESKPRPVLLHSWALLMETSPDDLRLADCSSVGRI